MSLRNLWPVLGFIALGLVSIGAILSVVLLWGVYYQHWDGPRVMRAAEIFPIPAGRVGSRTIPLREYLKDVRSIERYLASEEAKSQGEQRSVTDDDKKNALERALRVQAVEEIAASRNVVVSDQQMQALLRELNITSTSTEGFVQFIEANYGWTMEDFETHLARPLILTRLLTGPYAADHGGDPNALEDYLNERLTRPDVVRYVTF